MIPNVTAAILAGGLGTRLRRVVNDRPKVLAEIHGQPFLAYLLNQLSDSGIKTVILCTGYMGEQVRDALGESYKCLRIIYSQESITLGTGGALRLALPLLKTRSVLVMNGDSFCDNDLSALWKWHRGRKAQVSLALVKVLDPARYGQVLVGNDGAVLSFREKKGPGETAWVNAGVYLFEHSVLESISEGHAISLEREILPALIGKGLFGYQTEGRFLDIGTPESYSEAQQFF